MLSSTGEKYKAIESMLRSTAKIDCSRARVRKTSPGPQSSGQSLSCQHHIKPESGDMKYICGKA